MKYLKTYQKLNENTIPDDIKSILQDILDEFTDSLNGNISYDITPFQPSSASVRDSLHRLGIRSDWALSKYSSEDFTNSFTIQFISVDPTEIHTNPLFIAIKKAYNLSLVQKIKDEIIRDLKKLDLPQRIYRLTKYELVGFEYFLSSIYLHFTKER